MSVSWKSCKFSKKNLQCESDFRPFNMRRRSTSMPLRELILLIQPWVLLRLMFLGWYSVPLFRVRTCWYCHGSCWNTPDPSACEDSGPYLEIWGPAAALGAIQLLNNLRWEVPATARFPAGMLLTEHRLEFVWMLETNVIHLLPWFPLSTQKWHVSAEWKHILTAILHHTNLWFPLFQYLKSQQFC